MSKRPPPPTTSPPKKCLKQQGGPSIITRNNALFSQEFIQIYHTFDDFSPQTPNWIIFLPLKNPEILVETPLLDRSP